MRAGRAIAELNVELMALDRNVPGVPDWSEIPAPNPDAAKLKVFFEKYELHRFAAETDAKPPAPAAVRKAPKPADDGQMDLFG